MKRKSKQFLAILLAIATTLTSVNVPAMAYQAEKKGSLSVTDKEGNTITEDKSWEEEFPNGTFAFKTDSANINEGDTEGHKITVYRLGGTKGEAVANIAVMPAVSSMDEEKTDLVIANAASNTDYTIQVENPITGSEDVTYSDVPLNTEDEYGLTYFDMTFKEGEWVKDIIVKPTQDLYPESVEFTTLTIYDCQGAEFTESANRYSLGIEDDEAAIDSEIGFDVESVRFDKSSGKASVTLKRTKGLQYVASAEYKTVDGSAKAGEDYTKKEGIAAFSGGFDTTTIEVDLINDKKQSSKDVSFTIELSDPKAATLKEGATAIRVDLFNTDSSKSDNVSTKLSEGKDIVDVTAKTKVAKNALTQTKNKVKVEEVKKNDYEAEYTPVIGEDEMSSTQLGSDTSLQLPDNLLNDGWQLVYNVKDNVETRLLIEEREEGEIKPTNDGSGTKATTEDGYSTGKRATMYYYVPNLSNRYSQIQWHADVKTYDLLHAFYHYMSGVMGYIGENIDGFYFPKFTDDSGTDSMDNLANSTMQGKRRLFYFKGDEADVDDSGKSVGSANSDFEDINANSDTHDCIIFQSALSQRKEQVRDRDSQINVTTLNLKRRYLSKTPIIRMYTADDTELSGDSSFASNIKPGISMSSDKGGYTGTGSNPKLFIGSQLNFSSRNNYLLNQVRLEGVSSGDMGSRAADANGNCSVAMENLTRSRTVINKDDQYVFSTYMSRRQKLAINLRTSIAETDTESIKNDKVKRILDNITYEYAPFVAERFSFDRVEADFGTNSLENFANDNYLYTTNNSIENIKSFNLHLNDGTMVLYNNKTYSGNEDIKISKEHYTSASISFSVYTPDTVSYERKPEIIGQDKVSIYADEDNDGKYSTGDTYITDYKDGTVCMDELLPHNGKNLLLVVKYAVMPACLKAPPGKNVDATYDIVPSYVTALSEDLQKNLSKEQKEYRDITSLDGKIKMYGMSNGTISVPIGKDASPATFSESTKKYSWTPDWKGNLVTPYETPEDIYLDETKMPDGFSVATASKTTDAAKHYQQLNGYLGCLHGNETYVLTSRQQGEITATSMGVFTTKPEPGAQTFDQQQSDTAEVPENTSSDAENQPEETECSPSVQLPTIEVGLGPLSFEMGEEDIGFSVGIPLFSKSKGEDPTKGPKQAAQDAIDELKEAMKKNGDKNIFKQLREQKKKQTGTAGTRGGQGKPYSKNLSVDIAVNMSFVWSFSKVTGKYEFSSAMIAASFAGEVRLEKRFTPCPIFYVYLNAGFELNVSTGLEVEKEKDDNGNVHNNVKWKGLELEPSVFIEAGVGAGVEMAKVEVYVKVSVTASFSFSPEDPAKVNSFETEAGIGFRAVFLFFSYEMDCIGLKVGYDADDVSETDDGWSFQWVAAGQELGGSAVDEDCAVPGADVTVQGPKNHYKKQQIHTSEDNAGDDMSSQAFDVDGIDEFQVSGYGSNASAVELGTNLDAASEYQLLTVGDKNYVLYTISRKTPVTKVDVTQLVLSELSTTSSTGNDVLGLCNPIDPDNETPYIVVDRKESATPGTLTDDTTGDLHYRASVEGTKIIVNYTSYEEDAYSHVASEATQDETLATVSRYTQVKKSTFDTTQSDGFGEAEILDDTTASFDFLPRSVNDDVQFYTTSTHFTATEMQDRVQEYQEYYEESAEGNEGNGVKSGDPYAEANYKYAIALDNMYGKYSVPNFLVKQEDGTYNRVAYTLPADWETNNTRIVDMQAIAVDDNTIYMAINTEEAEIVTNANNEQEMITVKKMYLQKADIVTEESENTLNFGSRILFKTLVDYDKSNELDGEYQETALVGSGYEAPTFTNVKFMNGKLSGEAENFLLYVMNGTTYVVNEASLTKLMNAEVDETITVQKLFAENEGESTQTDTVIGVDGDGNISAVYGETVQNTTNNALYVTKYDPTIGSFGEGFMLAMNHMQTYEDSIAQGLSAQEMKSAFLDETLGGGEDKFVFTSPQIALGAPTSQDANGTLTILTKGTFTKLKKETFDLGDETVTEYLPDTTDGSMAGTMGIYAITYGIGKQQMGEARLHFEEMNLAPGAKDSASVSFRNTGDVAIRGSVANPISLKLLAAEKDNEADTIELAAWNITSNVLAGQEVTTNNVLTNEMPADIANRIIYFTVGEDSSYITEGAFSASTIDGEEGVAKITVGTKAEVSFGETKITVDDDVDITKVNGIDCVVADFETTIRNNGDVNAEGIKFDVEYSKGKDAESQEIYQDLELDGVLVTSDTGTPLTGTGNSGSFAWKGSVDEAGTVIANETGTAEKGKNYSVKGKINIPLTCFDTTSAIDGVSLRINMDTDTGEYTKSNNETFVKLIPTTIFQLPEKVNLSIGKSSAFEVGYTAASILPSNISTIEMAVSANGTAAEAEAKLLDSISYNPVSGYVTIKAAKEGSGIIRITDTTTGSFADIAFLVTSAGVNISKENPNLEFENAVGGTAWEDRMIGSIQTGATLPYEGDVCIGSKDNKVTFITYAQSMDLYFDGTVRVDSINSFGYIGDQYKSSNATAPEGMYYAPTHIDFGNTSLKKHIVTITAVSDELRLDKYVEYYSDDGKLEKDIIKDSVNPVITLGKSINKLQTGKLQAGTLVEIPIYVYDNIALNSVIVDGVGAEERESVNFAKTKLTITKNGTYEILVKDASGNRSLQTIDVDWYDTGVNAPVGQKDDLPSVTKATLVDENGSEITGFTNSNAYIHYEVQADRNIEKIELLSRNMLTGVETTYATGVSSAAIVQTSTNEFDTPINDNGYYVVKVTDEAGRTGFDIISVEQISPGPKVTLSMTKNSYMQDALFYSIGDEDNEIPLKKVVVCEGNITSDSQTQIQVPSESILYQNDYDNNETMASGVISLAECTETNFTIFGMDECDKVKRYSFDDKTNLQGLAIVNGSYDLSFNEPFTPYVHDYELVLPEGYPLDQVPEFVPSFDDTLVDVEQIVEGDKVIYTVESASNSVEYTITIKRLICTCDIKIEASGNSVKIPHDKTQVNTSVVKEVSCTGCEVPGHENYRLEDIEYEYEVTEGNDYAEVDEDGNLVFKRLPEGVVSQNVAVKLTATLPTCTEEMFLYYKIYNEYEIGIETMTGGQIECEGDIMYGVDAEASSGTILISAGENLVLTAVPKEEYEFGGWYNKANELICSTAEISYEVTKDDKLIASFVDITKPTGAIVLTDQAEANVTEAVSGGVIQYSQKGFNIAIQASDDETGIRSIEYQILDADAELDESTGWLLYDAENPPVVTTSQEFIVYARLTDNASNTECVQSNRAILDTEGAAITMTPSFTEGNFTNDKDASVKVKVVKNKADIKSITYAVDKNEFTSDSNEFTIKDLPDGEYDVTVSVKDKSERVTKKTCQIKKDTATPKLELTGVPTGIVEQFEVKLVADCGISGLEEMKVTSSTIAGGMKILASDTFTITENGTYEFSVVNKAGSKVTKQLVVSQIVKGPARITTANLRTIQRGKTARLSYKAIALVDSTMLFNSSNKRVATVNKKGVVTARKIGTATIKITAKSNTKVQAFVKVRVTLPRVKAVQVKKIALEKGAKKTNVVTWKGVYQAKKYRVYRSASLSGTYKKVATVKASAYVDIKAKSTKKYFYKVVAVASKAKYNAPLSHATGAFNNAVGNSNNKTEAIEMSLARCSGLRALNKKSSIRLNWKKVKGATNYQIFRAESQYGTYDEVALTDKPLFQDQKVDKGKKYYYRIRAVKKEDGDIEAMSQKVAKITIKRK